jgi:alpha-1,2-mannosyltransferase
MIPSAEDHPVTPTQGRLAVLLVFLFLYVPFVTSNGFQLTDERAIDLPSFYFAADVTFNDHASPYRAGAWEPLEQRLQQKVFPFLYPPPSLLFFWPVSWFSYDAVKIGLLVINHLGLLYLMYLLFFRILKLPAPWSADPGDEGKPLAWLIPAALVLYVLNFQAIAVTLQHGQINILVLILVCLFWVGVREDRHPALTALPLAAAILLKTYPVLFLPLLLIRRRYLVAAWGLGFTVTLLLVSLVVLPQGTWGDWMNTVLPTGGYGKIPFNLFSPAMPWNQSINGFTARLFLHPDYGVTPSVAAGRWVPALLAGAVVVALIWLSLRLNQRTREIYRDEEIALVLTTTYLIAPLSWEHHLLFVLPAALLAVVHLCRGRLTVGWGVAVGLAAAIVAWPLAYLFEIRNQGTLNLLVSLKFFATVVLWAYLLVRLWRFRSDHFPTGAN